VTPQPARVLPATMLKKRPRPPCPTGAVDSFEPETISVDRVIRHASVLQPPRDTLGIPGVRPLNRAGKLVFAFDREQGVRPGDRAGNVLLNTHTWPRGTALGSRLLAELDVGSQIVVNGQGSRKICYRVTQEVQVSAYLPMWSYYATDGKPQLAIVVCSGTRLGPRNWNQRTVWFASPTNI